MIAFGGSIRLLDSNDVEIWTRNMPGEAFVKVYRDTIIAVCSQSGASMVYILNDSGETIRQFSLGVLMSYPSIAARENTLYVSGTNPVLFGVAVAVSLSGRSRNSGNSTPARPTRIAVRWMTAVIFTSRAVAQISR